MKFNVKIAFVIVLISEFIFYAETKSKLQLKLENQKYSNYKDVILLHYGVAEVHHKIYDRFIEIAKHFTFDPKVNYFRLIINIAYISMTTLLTHTVAHSTKPSFMPKTNNQPPKKFLSLALS